MACGSLRSARGKASLRSLRLMASEWHGCMFLPFCLAMLMPAWMTLRLCFAVWSIWAYAEGKALNVSPSCYNERLLSSSIHVLSSLGIVVCFCPPCFLCLLFFFFFDDTGEASAKWRAVEWLYSWLLTYSSSIL